MFVYIALPLRYSYSSSNVFYKQSMFVECLTVTNSNITLTPYHAYVNGYCRYWLYLIP